MTIATASSAVTLFYMNVNQFDGNVAYQFGAPTRRVRPFVSGGLGASVLSADGLDTESKLSWNVGAGLKWSFHRNVGARFDARYRPILLNASGFCGPFSFCETSFKPFQFGSALVIRF